MQPVAAARVAIASLSARRFGRDVPEAELARELAERGIAGDAFSALLRELETRRLAQRTRAGWRLVSPPVSYRARPATARLAWIR